MIFKKMCVNVITESDVVDLTLLWGDDKSWGQACPGLDDEAKLLLWGEKLPVVTAANIMRMGNLEMPPKTSNQAPDI